MFFHRLCPAVIALDIQASFGLTGTLLGVLGSAYFYSYAIMQLPTGLMADSWGPRKTVSSFFVLAGLGYILMGMAPNLSISVLGRILVGIGATFFQILIGAVLTAQSHGQKLYTTLGFQYMFLICLAGATLSLAAAMTIKETLNKP